MIIMNVMKETIDNIHQIKITFYIMIIMNVMTEKIDDIHQIHKVSYNDHNECNETND